MSSSTGNKSRLLKGSGWQDAIKKLKLHSHSNSLQKLFQDEHQIVFELIKILYEDAIELRAKLELLLIFEQECCEYINKNSVDQVITALIDIYETNSGNRNTDLKEQLLITVATIFIEHEEFLDQELGTSFISKLIETLKKTNSTSDRRVRTVACTCLMQMEEWKPGLLWKWKDLLGSLALEERTDVSQDYVHLLITVIKNNIVESEQEHQDKGILQTVSHVMDNVALLTGPGAVSMLMSVARLVESSQPISPSVFKPFLLHYTPCLSPSIVFIMLHIQNKFHGEILSPAEERTLILKVVGVANHPNTPKKSRLLLTHWLNAYVQHRLDKGQSVPQGLYEITQPSVFDTLGVHVCKMYLHCLCTPASNYTDISKDLFYLSQLADTTGGIRVTLALYSALYSHVCHHSCEEVYAVALSITKRLFQKFPHLIPLIVDFLQSLQTFQSDQKFHVEIMALLHTTVVSIPLTTLLGNYQNYLQVWILSAQDPNMPLQKQLRRMLELAREASLHAMDDWTLGSLLLSVCRTMMLHHHTDVFYSHMGDFLFYMMHHFNEPDIQDYARFFYALLTLTSNKKTKDILNADGVEGLRFGENFSNFLPGSMVRTLPSDIHFLEVSPIQWSRKNVSVEFKSRIEKDEDVIFGEDKFLWYKEKQKNLKPYMKCEMDIEIKDEADADNLIAFSLHTACQDKKTSIEDIHIPFLSKKEKTDFVLKFHPAFPIPCSLEFKSFFSQDKATFQCNLDPFHVSLGDFLVPFPWHILPPDIQQQQLFDSLWSHCTSEQNADGVESVKVLPHNRKHLTSLWIKAHINTKESERPAKDSDADCFLFYVMPSYHLLFQTRSRSTDTVVEIASDFPPILEHLDNFLENISN